MSFFIQFIIIITGSYLSIYLVYNFVLLFAHFVIKERSVPPLTPKTKFGFIIPAHNEEILLGRLLKSINNQKYPSRLFETIVVADNCTDNTARIGIEMEAHVLEREDLQRIGKGYAINFALGKVDINLYDAIVIIDADSTIKNDALMYLDQLLGERKNIIQCYNGVANPDESWFTRLLHVSRTIGNEIYFPAKQKLGLSSQLMGNGMCFSTKLLLKYGWEAFTVGEDWEYYAKLIQEGETISFARNSRVYHQESSSLRQASSQRIRWSSGRFAIAWKYGFAIFWRGLVEMSFKKIDASFPLIFPNPSLGMNITVIGLVLSLVLPVVMNRNNFVLWFFSLALLQFFIFMIGAMYTQNKLKNVLSLFVVPVFLAWKMGIDSLSALGFGRKKWIRTFRKP